jgi:hypothetical protein
MEQLVKINKQNKLSYENRHNFVEQTHVQVPYIDIKKRNIMYINETHATITDLQIFLILQKDGTTNISMKILHDMNRSIIILYIYIYI